MHTGQETNVLQKYLNSIQDFETLSFEEEQDLARRWRNDGDREAAHQLVNAHLRLVVKVALGFKGYGLPISEVIQEGNMGLMHAVTRFDPDRGFRLSTYAMWWIRAAIQEYVLNSWSLVKIGTTSAQKKLFFNLRRMRNKLGELADEELSPDAVAFIAEELNVKEKEVRDMHLRLSSMDQSLNALVSDDVGSEWLDWLEDDRPTQEDAYSDIQTTRERRQHLTEALDRLDKREKEIFLARRLNDTTRVPTLEDLSQQFGISRERVRQLEVRAFNKIKKFMKGHAA